jgi:broad specificity phosphatase PhoE
MPLIRLVRHGKAAAGWGDDPDPGLADLGRQQAEKLAETMAPDGPLDLLVSPLKRTRETAAPLEARWGAEGLVDHAVAEILSPSMDLAARRQWLDGVMARRWADVDAALLGWRQAVVDRLLALERDTVVVSHFVAINAAVGAALGDDRVVCFRPDHCSMTLLEAKDGRLRLLALGHEAATEVR